MIRGQIRSTAIAADPRSTAGHGHVLAVVGGLLLPLGVFAALAARVALGEHGGDTDILRFSDRYYRPSIAGPLEVALWVGIGLGAAIAVGAVVVLLAKRRWGQALFWTLAVGGVLAFDPLLKEIFHRPPLGDHRGGSSFPSGNAMASVAIVAAIVLTSSPPWPRRALIVGVPIVIAYGVALVYQFWHYPSDVVAGWCIAVAWVTGLWLALRRAARGARILSPAQGGPIPAGQVRARRRIPSVPGRVPER
jgi:membrane-associated phospholipid phosphatase